MLHSKVTTKGQTTIPSAVREALRIKPGDQLEYRVDGDKVTVSVSQGTRSLAGALASKKGSALSFAEIRTAAANERIRERSK